MLRIPGHDLGLIPVDPQGSSQQFQDAETVIPKYIQMMNQELLRLSSGASREW